MSKPDYIPQSDPRALAWARTFSNGINADPAAFHIEPAEAAELALLVEQFAAAYRLARDPDTRTRPAVSRKNDARDLMKAKIRILARRIQGQAQLSDSQRMALGLNPLDVPSSPWPAPASQPKVSLSPLGARRSRVRLHDPAEPGRTGKPSRVTGAHLWVSYGAQPPADASACTFLGTVTRTRAVVSHPADKTNTTAWIMAQWVNARGQAGPLSIAAPVSVAA